MNVLGWDLTCRLMCVRARACVSVLQRIQQRAEKKLFLDQMVNRGSVAGEDTLGKPVGRRTCGQTHG